MSNVETVKVAVYGTLKKGGRLAGQMDNKRVSSKDCTIKGKVYNLGWFPGMKLGGESEVVAELHEYSDVKGTLSRLDSIEGYNPNDEKRSLFNRREITVTTDDGEETAFVYEYNGSVADKTLVESGNWDINQ